LIVAARELLRPALVQRTREIAGVADGTVALRVDLIAMQEIFRLTFAPSRQPAAMSDWHGSYWRGWVGRYWPGPEACGARRSRSLNATVPIT